MDDLNKIDNPIVHEDDLYGKKINSKPLPDPNVGVDTDNNIIDLMGYSGVTGKVDMSTIESFRQVSQARDQIYDLIDTMSTDPTISAVLETYAEDATETNANGDVIWAESDDPKILHYVKYLLDCMDVNKHAYQWVYNLCKYGDVYLRLYRNSDFDDFLDVIVPNKDSQKLNEELQKINDKKVIDNLFEGLNDTDKKQLQEDVVVRAYKKSDSYAHYVEMVPNPAEMFELTKFGKTYTYICAPVNMSTYKTASTERYLSAFRYMYRLKDVKVYDPTTFVHAYLEGTNESRLPEVVSIFLDDNANFDVDSNYTFNVRRGQSILYNTFKIWRELSLLENALLLNRVTKSSILRIIGVEVGDMPKESVPKHLMGIKQLVEQKSAINTGQSLSEYTNPGPMENNIYIPTHNGQGTITTQQVGGDVDVRAIADVDYYRDRMFSGLKVPKQFFGFTEDGAGFNGGQSLTIISSRYGKTIKRIQNSMVQAITDCVNLMLLDAGFSSYINKFTIRMQTPTTQEEIDRRDNTANKIAVASDIMNLLGEIEDPIAKLRILKSLISDIVDDTEIISVLQEQIDKLEEEAEENPDAVEDDTMDDDFGSSFGGGSSSFGGGSSSFDDNDIYGDGTSPDDFDFGGDEDTDIDASEPSSETMSLPTPSDLGGDFTDANMEI